MKLGYLQRSRCQHSVVQSEVSQKEKNKYGILMRICGIQEKMLQVNYLQGRKRDADEENGHADTVGRRGQRDELRDQDSLTHTHARTHARTHAIEKRLCSTGSSAWCL